MYHQKILDFNLWMYTTIQLCGCFFVRRAQDVFDVKKLLVKMVLIFKSLLEIENSEGVENIDEILKIADGIMVARGDLGVEVPAEDVPLIQKEALRNVRIWEN
ncbi:MAG: pyruvate kinase [Thomasclavelia ramosa]